MGYVYSLLAAVIVWFVLWALEFMKIMDATMIALALTVVFTVVHRINSFGSGRRQPDS